MRAAATFAAALTFAAAVALAQDTFTLDLENLPLRPADPRTEARLAQWNSPIGRVEAHVRQEQAMLGRSGLVGGWSPGVAVRVGFVTGLPPRVVLMQIAPPTRMGVRAYDEIRAELEQDSGRINGRFASSDWVPIRYLNKGISRRPLMGFFRNADVGLVTPLRDGMNLVAKEYIVAQDPEDPGMLVLSGLAGAACELTDAVIVNPYDRDSVADGIATAITMSLDERRERHASMMKVLRKNDITAWRTRFVDTLLRRRDVA